MEFDSCGSIVPPLEIVYESDRKYFEENPGAEWGVRLPHPDEWPGIPQSLLGRMYVLVTQIAPDIRGRQLVDLPPWMFE
jgi:hypothetical protein